jgi:hypothetical protein
MEALQYSAAPMGKELRNAQCLYPALSYRCRDRFRPYHRALTKP